MINQCNPSNPTELFTVLSHPVLSNSLGPLQALLFMTFPAKNTGVGCHSLLQGIFLTQGSNQGLLYYRKIPYCLNHQGSSNYTPIQINFPSGIPVFWGATICCNNYFVQPVPSFSFLTGLLLKQGCSSNLLPGAVKMRGELVGG